MMPCDSTCPDPKLCAKYNRHVSGRLWQLWKCATDGACGDIDRNAAVAFKSRLENPASISEPVVAQAPWPVAVKLVGILRNDADTGVGDTIARQLDRFGADALKTMYKKLTGHDCGCANRQQVLNAMFPYKR